MGCDEDSVRDKTKSAHASYPKQPIHLLFPMDRQEFSCSQESKAPSCLTIIWEDKHHHSKHPPLPLSSPTHILSLMSYSMGCSQGQLGLAVLPVSLPSFLALPASLLVGWDERQKRPWQAASAAQKQQKHLCIKNTAFSTSSKHSFIPATLKKTIPDKAGTFFWQGKSCWCLNLAL